MLLSPRKNGLTSLFKEVTGLSRTDIRRSINQAQMSTKSFVHKVQSSYPAEVRKWNCSPFFSAKDVVKFGVKIWWNFPCYVFQGLGVWRKISPKFHVKNGVKNGKFHANFTLPGCSADKLTFPPKNVQVFEGFLLISNSFSSFWAFFGGGGRVNQVLQTRILWTSGLLWQMFKINQAHTYDPGCHLQKWRTGRSTLWTNAGRSGEIHMDQSLVHTLSWGNSHGPMVL